MSALKWAWAIGAYRGEEAKRIQAQAQSGIGYFVLDDHRERNQLVVTAALKFPLVKPLPAHLQFVRDPAMLKQLNAKDQARHNHRPEPEPDELPGSPFPAGAIPAAEFERGRMS